MNRFLLGVALVIIISLGPTIAQQPSSTPTPTQEPDKTASPGQIKNTPPVPAPTTRPQRSGGITGRVIGDGGQALAGAPVFVWSANLASNPAGASAALLQPPLSDQDGWFEAKNVTPGAYSISVRVPGYISASDGDDGPPFYRPGDSVTIRLIKGGVITGRVTGSDGEPVVGARVRALRIANRATGQAASSGFPYLIAFMTSLTDEWETDDRGIYRIYGLEPGSYEVAAGGGAPLKFGPPDQYDRDAPTYYPSSMPDTAGKVMVDSGQEVSAIDIRYRSYAGHAIIGTVSGNSGPGTAVILSSTATATIDGFAVPGADSQSHGFVFDAVPDGEYDLVAVALSGEDALLSAPRRVAVKGADLTGLDLSLMPLGSIGGQVVMEVAPAAGSKAECKGPRRSVLEETVVSSHREADQKSVNQAHSAFLLLGTSQTSLPDAKGDFLLKSQEAGLHRLELDLPSEDWYVRSITRPGATPATKPLDVARDGIPLKAGDKVTAIIVAIAEGAASLRGRVVTPTNSVPSSSRMRIFLIPASKEAADDVLRYSEAPARPDGTFGLTNLAPGRYWLLARPVPDVEPIGGSARRVAGTKEGRAGLRLEGETLNNLVELKPCERVANNILQYMPASSSPTVKNPGDN